MSVSRLITFIAVFISLSSNAQTRIRVPVLDYSPMDEFAIKLSAQNIDNADTLASRIMREYDKPHFRLRVAFRWIAENIQYDVRSKKPAASAQEVFRLRKANAEGFCNLLNVLCAKMKIQSETVPGFLRKGLLPGKSLKKMNHCWNTVKLYNKWYLLDVTLASGFTEKKGRVFTKRFNDMYYALHPRQIILTHLPMNSSRQYLDTIVDRKTFFNFPEVYDAFFENGLYALTPADGIVELNNGQLKKFYFKTMDSLLVGKIEITEGKKSERIPVTFRQSDNVIQFDYLNSSKKKKSINIFLDGSLIATYLIVPEKKKR